ncbi:MAG: glutamine synthetase, partial [Planctomycetaceae bacterium]|nr:glutamine synthetase [Planctomycetaceae bacterium]
MPDRGRDRRSPAGLVEAALGAPPAEWTAEMLARLCEERGIRLVTLLHVGGDGLLKGLDFVPRDGRHLRAVLSSGERADGSSLFRDGGIRAGKSDVVLLPRPDRAFLDPFPGEPALAVLCGHRDRDGAPLAVSPDTVVRRAHARLREETGLDLHAHGEVEYFLGRLPGEDGVQGTSERGYHAVAPAVFGEPLRRRAMVMLAGMGAPLKYGHGEVGFAPPEEGDPLCWEQHEIELGLAPLPEAADAVLLAQWVLRRLAREEGMRVSFEPVLRAGHAG